MRKMNNSKMMVGLLAGTAVLALAGCGQVDSGAVPAAATPAPAAPAVAVAPLVPATPVAAMPAAAVVPAAPAQQNGPALASMQLAQPPSKMGVAVDLRYRVDGDINSGQPVTVHLAAVPRVAGSNLEVGIKEEAGISTTAKIGQALVQKADASNAYRQQMTVSKQAGGPNRLRVLVTMETPEGSAHSWFTVPLESAPAANKAIKAKLE